MATINISTDNNNKRVSNTLNKTNKYPYILHKNIKNYRNKNRCTNCSSEETTYCNNKLSEKIYRGLDFQTENGNTCSINENYKIAKAKNRTTSGIQTPKCFTDCLNNTTLVNNSRINCINTKINPYIQEYNKYKINNNKYNVHVKTNANNYRYSNYSNYLKKKRSCIKK